LTGFRRGELLGLKWKDVDFENCRINLCRQVVLDGNNRPIITDVLKTEGSSQEISVMPIVIERLRKCKLKKSEFLLKLSLKIDEDDLIFSTYDRHPYRPDVVSHRFTAERKRLGLRDGLSMHSTRHTFATLGVEVGIQTPKLMDLMRHSDIKITMGYVDRMKDSSYKIELEKLSKAVESIFDEQAQAK
jgi:integrase